MRDQIIWSRFRGMDVKDFILLIYIINMLLQAVNITLHV